MFLGIDLGTSSVKALLLSEEDQVLKEVSEAYSVTSPQLGWAETNPNDWWQATCKAVQRCCQGFSVKAISFSGQMHGTVLCDAQAKPLRAAILWADTRSEAQLAHYVGLSASQKLALANPIVVGMMGPSLLWLKQHETLVYQQARWALLPKDWLRLKMTGEALSDPSDASATLLYDLSKDTWANGICEQLGIRTDLLPDIKGSSQNAGTLSPSAAAELGLKAGIPLATGGADAACSAYGSGLVKEGQAQINIGTAMQIFAIRSKARADKTLRTHLYRNVENAYYAMAAMANAGLALEWVRGILSLSWETMYQEAFSVPSGSEGVVFLPYLMGERTPHLNPNARTCWQNMSLKHTRGHLARAAFEGVAFALKDGLVALEATGIHAKTLRLSGGGSLQVQWRQLIADVLQKPLESVYVPSASAKGAALLAASSLGYNFKPDTHENAALTHAKPDEALERAYQDFSSLYYKLYPSTQ